MKKKNLLLSLVASIGFAITNFAQVPTYVPTDGLVGWWPFNGNANDESGNGNNGTVNGATLSSDRIGNSNQAYSFDGVDDYIISNGGNQFVNQNQTISFWINFNNVNSFTGTLITLGSNSSCLWGPYYNNFQPGIGNGTGLGCGGSFNGVSHSLNNNIWNNLIIVTNGSLNSFFVDGIFIGSNTNSNGGGCSNSNLYFGVDIFSVAEYFNGKIDDIGIWNRAITQQEITDLYNGCQLSVTTQPTDQTSNINASVDFVVASPESNTTFQWQMLV